MTWKLLALCLSRSLVLASLWALFSASPSLAQSGNHGDGHAAGHDQYKTWTGPNGLSCCNERKTDEDGNTTGDCRPVRARQAEDGTWEAWVSEQSEWIPIPKDRDLGTSEDGRSHLCAIGHTVFCFKHGEIRS